MVFAIEDRYMLLSTSTTMKILH